MSLFYVSGCWKFKIRNHLTILNKKYIFKYFFRKFVKSKKIDFIKYHIDLILSKEMVSSSETFDVLKYSKMTKLTQTKHRFGILAWFTHNIAYQTGFENSTGNTNYIQKYFFFRIFRDAWSCPIHWLSHQFHPNWQQVWAKGWWRSTILVSNQTGLRERNRWTLFIPLFNFLLSGNLIT